VATAWLKLAHLPPTVVPALPHRCGHLPAQPHPYPEHVPPLLPLQLPLVCLVFPSVAPLPNLHPPLLIAHSAAGDRRTVCQFPSFVPKLGGGGGVAMRALNVIFIHFIDLYCLLKAVVVNKY
jgi:hypothetical protein